MSISSHSSAHYKVVILCSTTTASVCYAPDVARDASAYCGRVVCGVMCKVVTAWNLDAIVVAKKTTACLSSDIRKQSVGDHIKKRTERTELIADAINSVKSGIQECMHVLCSFQRCTWYRERGSVQN